MADRHWVLISDVVGPIGFCLTVLSSSVLLFLIFSQTSPIKGAYKSMLIVFCIFTMFYSFVEMVLQPLIHLYDDTLYLIQRKRFDLPKGWTRVIPTTYCWCYAMSFCLFALQFLYRYVAVCKPHFVCFFTGCYFYYWLALILSLATSWGLTAAFMFPQTNRTTESFLYVIKTSYDLDPYWTDYVAYKYFDTDENHVRWVNLLSFFGVLQHGLVITMSFSTLFYCGIKTYLNIKEHVGMSTKTRSFQLQLFRALVVQTCLSMCMMYMPIGFMFSCPYFDLQLGAITNYQTIMAQLYPGIDPFVVLFIIDAYRKRILSMYCGCYAMSFVLFALQFLYRYVATCKPLYVELFQGIRFLFWIFGAFSIALSWEAAAFFLFPQSDRTQKMFLHILKYSYDLDPDFMDYVPYRYFENDEGVRRVIMLNIVGIIQHVIIMGVSFGTLFYCAFKTYTTISRHKGMSVKTKELQMQLFRALVVQIGFVYALLLYEGHQFKRTHITKELSLQEGTYSVPKVLQSVQGVNIMSDNYWFELTNVIGQIGFYVSVAANFILLLLIHYVSCVMMGSYKTLLIFITFFSMFFSFVEMEAKPLIHMYDNTLFLIYQKWEHKSGLITKIIPTTYCWCYSMSFALLTLQFIYRYIAICRYSLLNYIEGKTVYLWLLGATLIGGTWAAAVLLLFPHTEKTDESFRHLLNESYRLDPRVTDYVPYKYFYIVNGTRIFDKINMTGVVHHLFVIAITLLIVVFCGVSIYRNAKKQETASSKTRRLQIQLFRALIFQTLIPCFFNFLPLTFLYLCPILNIQLGPRTNYQVIMAQIYPAMDPIVLFFIIEDYRSTLFDIIMFRWTSKIACYDYDQTQYAEFMRTETNSRRITIF